MLNYAIELEFFVFDKEGKVVPAYKVTNNLDGNPVIGELRTSIHSDISSLVFELKKLIFNEARSIAKAGYVMQIIPSAQVDNEFLRQLRLSSAYVNKKNVEVLEEKSVYDGKLGKLLKRGLYKASLQINISDNYEKTISYKNKNDEFKSETVKYSQVFDYYSIIKTLDKAFAKEIADTKRVKGVYSLKPGTLGSRVEYRSLPNNIDFEKLIDLLNS